MAELPEVETYTRDLRASVIGRRILGASIPVPATIRFGGPERFTREVTNAHLLDAQRRAKWMLLTLDGQRTLALHCMLFGSLRLEVATAPQEPHLCLALPLDDGNELRLLDRLGYARAAVMLDSERDARLNLDALGPEVLSSHYTPEALLRSLARKRIAIKSALLDQHVVAGMGNRDADESLWRAAIDPRLPASTLSPDAAALLTQAMRAVLEEGISRRGTMPDLWGQRGYQRGHIQVFERAGRPCPRCGAVIQRIRLGGRNTFYCPSCQAPMTSAAALEAVERGVSDQ